MLKNKIILFLLFLILSPAIAGYSQNVNTIPDSALKLNEQQKQILILNSFGTGLPIPDDAKQGIHISLEAGGVSLKDIFFEDLDLVRSSSSEHKLNLVTLLQHKLEHQQIGVVIVIGSPAIEFLANEGKELFPNAAIVALITPNVNALNNDPRKIMYLPWRVDAVESIKLALELFPSTKHVLVITGAKDDVLPFLDEAKKGFIPWENKLDFEYTNEMTYEEMIQKATSLSNESIILYSTFFTDKLNRSFIPAEVVAEVCEKSKVPVFATLEYYMGLGIVGGALLETEMLGKQAGSLALDYLNGQIVLKEHITSFETHINAMLDWQELKRFQSNKKNIPADCIIVGKPFSLWEEHKLIVIAVIVIFLILSSLIITLSFWNRRIQKMKTAAMESEARFRVMIENAPEAVIVVDIATKKIVDANAKAEQLFGCSRQELFKGGPELFYHQAQPDEIDLKEIIASDYSMVLKGEEVIIEQAIHSKDGNDLICEVRLVQLPNRNKQLIRGSFIDITQRKQMELELINAKEKAEESDRLKTAFLANMSHEIRTPMNGILGFASLLKKTGLTGEKQQSFIEIIEKSGARMLNTINDIVDISKIEAGQMVISLSKVNINEIIEYFYSFFLPEADKKGIHLSINKGLPNKESIVETDLEKLNSVLINLIKNAIKYSNDGNIEIGYELKKENAPSELEFYIKDTGMGIPKNRQQAIFERFVQVDIEDKDALQGSGLGLAISKAYIEMLGGKIWVESEEGIGSTFYFTIPY